MCSETDPVNVGGQQPSLPNILVFHKVQPGFSFGSTNFSPGRLDRLFADLERRGYSFRSVSKVVHNPHQKHVAIAFDDGYQHLIDSLPTVIEKYRLAPTVFMPTAYIGLPNRWDYSYVFQSSPHLDQASIKVLAGLGVEFASHGHSHQPLTRLSDSRIKHELEISRKKLQDITGREVNKISYPFGRFNRRILDAAAETGYTRGFTMNFPTFTDNPLAQGRFAVYAYDSCFTIRQKLSGGRLYRFEKIKSTVTNRLSHGTGLYRLLSRN